MLRPRDFRAGLLVVVAFWTLQSRPVAAQGLSLGGYGALAPMAPGGMGSTGPIIPYGGSLSGFMPSRMGAGGTGLSFSSRNSAASGSARTSFRLSSMSTAMPMTSGAFVQKAGAGAGTRVSLFSRGLMGTGAGMSGSMGSASQSIMPPYLGYPFYQPPSLLWPSSSFMGMSSM